MPKIDTEPTEKFTNFEEVKQAKRELELKISELVEIFNLKSFIAVERIEMTNSNFYKDADRGYTTQLTNLEVRLERL